MNIVRISSQYINPFSRSGFWGRQRELRTIYGRLISTPPQSCAIVGETFIGKTTLLHYLAAQTNTTLIDDRDKEHTLTFVYLDCSLSIDSIETESGDYVAAQFWWQLYLKTCERLQVKLDDDIKEPAIDDKKSDLINDAYEIKSTLEELISDQSAPIIFALDNFEIVAHLHLRNSEWLRSLTQNNCAFIVTSRHLLYLLYQYTSESWNSPSPLYNLFSDPIHLGLMARQEVAVYLSQAQETAGKLGSQWNEADISSIQNFCGRHAEILRIGCSRLFEFHLQSVGESEIWQDKRESAFIEESIFNDARTVCNQLWNGLADPELRDEPRIAEQSREENTLQLTRHQKLLINIANGQTPTDKKILFDLEQRGLIEQVDGKLCVFAEVMHRFVLNKEAIYAQDTQTGEKSQFSNTPLTITALPDFTKRKETVSFTYLEGKVYDYLKSHVGEVCNRDDIKRAVWPNDPPTHTALQKIIERVRDKIEPDVNNPRYLIAIRGLGYMLREIPID